MPAFKDRNTVAALDSVKASSIPEDSAKAHHIKSEAKTHKTKAMNALKTVSPLLIKASYSSNPVEDFQTNVKKIDELSSIILNNLELDEVQHKWAKNQIQRMLGESLFYINSDKVDNIYALTTEIADMMRERASESPLFKNYHKDINQKISFINTFNSIALKFSQYSKNSHFNDEIEKSFHFIIEQSNKHNAELSVDGLNEDDKAEMLRALMLEFTKIVINFWEKANINGFVAFNTVEKMCENHIIKTVKTVQYLLK